MSSIVEAKVMIIYVASKGFDMYFCKTYFLKPFNRVKRLARRLNRDGYGGSAPHAHIFLGEVADVLCHKERDSEIDSESLLGCYAHYACTH